ncbi:hypothetical protein ACH4FX_12475 [Streptomyces sp. NPDC018019]|uniref:hypothetical protein n=1 Tax=Streptomyces sp. NPDC018019 TaxID=3365030 RepID=UPI0037BBB7F9
MPRATHRAEPPLIQDRSADNPAATRRAVREEARVRAFEVTGPKPVAGRVRGERVDLCLTEAQAQALIEAGHVVPAEAERPSVAAKKGDD